MRILLNNLHFLYLQMIKVLLTNIILREFLYKINLEKLSLKIKHHDMTPPLLITYLTE
jgi:hypothetical protein